MKTSIGVGLVVLGMLLGMSVTVMLPEADGHGQRGRPVIPANPSTIILPKLPPNVKQVLNVTNDPNVGVSVGFINTDDKPEMVQYSFERSSTGNFRAVYNKHFHFKFRER